MIRRGHQVFQEGQADRQHPFRDRLSILGHQYRLWGRLLLADLGHQQVLRPQQGPSAQQGQPVRTVLGFHQIPAIPVLRQAQTDQEDRLVRPLLDFQLARSALVVPVLLSFRIRPMVPGGQLHRQGRLLPYIRLLRLIRLIRFRLSLHRRHLSLAFQGSLVRPQVQQVRRPRGPPQVPSAPSLPSRRCCLCSPENQLVRLVLVSLEFRQDLVGLLVQVDPLRLFRRHRP